MTKTNRLEVQADRERAIYICRLTGWQGVAKRLEEGWEPEAGTSEANLLEALAAHRIETTTRTGDTGVALEQIHRAANARLASDVECMSAVIEDTFRRIAALSAPQPIMPNPMGALLCPPEIAETVQQSLAAWNALPDDERNGERPWVMGFNAGYEHAQEQAAERCSVPPPGWYCTRAPGHDGPCAAYPTPQSITPPEGGGWDHRFRRLDEGELINESDEHMLDDGSWELANCAGQKAPDPNYTSHRWYRRLKAAPEAAIATLSTPEASDTKALVESLEYYADQFCELGTSHEACGKLSREECSGCDAREALAQHRGSTL